MERWPCPGATDWPSWEMALPNPTHGRWRWGIRGVRLAFNPNRHSLPHLHCSFAFDSSCTLALTLCLSSCSTSPMRLTGTTVLHSSPPPIPPLPKSQRRSRPAREVPSLWSVTETARVGEVANWRWIRPRTRLQSGGGVVVAMASSCGDGGGSGDVKVEAPLGGGGGGRTMDPVMGDPLRVPLP
jgi:hypothetical protein